MRINIEKNRDDDTKLDIIVYLDDKGEMSITNIGLKPKGKRKFTYVYGSNVTDDYSYRKFNMEDRRKYKAKLLLKECPEELMVEALEEAWMSIKPHTVEVW